MPGNRDRNVIARQIGSDSLYGGHARPGLASGECVRRSLQDRLSIYCQLSTSKRNGLLACAFAADCIAFESFQVFNESRGMSMHRRSLQSGLFNCDSAAVRSKPVCPKHAVRDL